MRDPPGSPVTATPTLSAAGAPIPLSGGSSRLGELAECPHILWHGPGSGAARRGGVKSVWGGLNQACPPVPVSHPAHLELGCPSRSAGGTAHPSTRRDPAPGGPGWAAGEETQGVSWDPPAHPSAPPSNPRPSPWHRGGRSGHPPPAAGGAGCPAAAAPGAPASGRRAPGTAAPAQAQPAGEGGLRARRVAERPPPATPSTHRSLGVRRAGLLLLPGVPRVFPPQTWAMPGRPLPLAALRCLHQLPAARAAAGRSGGLGARLRSGGALLLRGEAVEGEAALRAQGGAGGVLVAGHLHPGVLRFGLEEPPACQGATGREGWWWGGSPGAHAPRGLPRALLQPPVDAGGGGYHAALRCLPGTICGAREDGWHRMGGSLAQAGHTHRPPAWPGLPPLPAPQITLLQLQPCP